MASEEFGLGFHSKEGLAFKCYLAEQAPEDVTKAIRELELAWYNLYPEIIASYRRLKAPKAQLSQADPQVIKLWFLLLADKERLRKYAPNIHRRLLIAGVDLACHHLIDVYEREGSAGVFKALNHAFPESGHAARFLHQELARLMQNRVAAKRRGKGAVEKRHEDQTAKTKMVVIEQWEKFPGDKSTAGTFANRFCGGVDAGAKPDCFYDVVTGDPLPVIPVSNRTVRKYINDYRKRK